MKNYSIFKLGLLIMVITSILSSCQSEWIEPEEITVPDIISFLDNIVPIFNKSCNLSSCHKAGFSILDLSPSNAYDDLFAKNLIDTDNPTESKIYKKLTDPTGSHKGRSTLENQTLILKWIEQGAKNN